MSGPAAVTARVVVPVPLPRPFDYLPPSGARLPPVGSRVLVPFGRRQLVGIVIDHGSPPSDPSVKLKPIARVLDAALLDDQLLELADWCCRYYGAAPGEAANLLLPGALRRVKEFRPAPEPFIELTSKGREAELSRAPRQAQLRDRLITGPLARRELVDMGFGSDVLKRMLDAGLVRAVEAPGVIESTPGPELNAEQRHAVAAILAARRRFEALLLAGITGSGKTEVYLQMAERVLARGRQVLFLIPEIALTPQLSARIQQRFPGQVALLHSGLSEGERLRAWESARQGQRRIVVGTRSALFTPLPDLGLIIVDEEHDSAFKQQDGFRYNARDLAIKRGQLEQVAVVLGSATPTLETLHAATTGRYAHARLATRPDGSQPPAVEAIDTRVHTPDEGLTAPLLDAMQQTLAAGHQCFLLLNRRGFARVLACDACGWVAECPDCDARLTIHAHNPRAVCHLCGHQEPRPQRCPQCGEALAQRGLGTQRLEQALARHYPTTPLIRLDRDSIRHKGALEEALDRIRQLDAAIVVGTQMLAKGHDFPQVGLVGVIDVDQGLFSVDLRATEHTLQLVVQAAGRAGRGDGGGRVLLQTGHPDHPLIRGLDAEDYPAMVAPLLQERAEAGLPPFGHLALVRVEASTAASAQRQAETVAGHLRAAAGADLAVLGPAPAPRHRVNRRFREQILLRSGNRRALHAGLAAARRAWQEAELPRDLRIAIDVDPVSLA